jgi:arsenite-transporting ATPase
MSLLELTHRRCIIVTGKGGVGKTTVTAALGRAFAQRNKRVLLAEIVQDPETPSQIFEALGGTKPTEEPQLADENLWVTLLTPAMGHLRFLQNALPLKVLADAALKSSGLRKFLSAAPGFSDMGVMYRMLDLLKSVQADNSPTFDLCIVDSPATGHALALAQIPEFLTRVLPGGPVFRAAQEGLATLTNPHTTACVIVTLPEALPVTEALELERGLQKYRLPVASIVVNRVPLDPFSDEERAALGTLPNHIFGAREMQRITRARGAIELLREKRKGPDVILNEVHGSPPETAKQLTLQIV